MRTPTNNRSCRSRTTGRLPVLAMLAALAWQAALPVLTLAAENAEVAGAAASPNSPADAQAAIDQLLSEDAKFHDLAARDPRLLETLRNQPDLAVRLAARPSWAQRVLDLLTNPWVLFGFGAQCLFMMRFLVQWIASERKRRSYVPVAFWYFSLAGGVMLLTYAIQRRDPVFILGQSLGLMIYLRNLVLIYRRAGARREALAERSLRRSVDPVPPDDAVGSVADPGLAQATSGEPAAIT